jgi:5-methylthioadenosine/S-adenosylhomocysteine deaminase
MAADTVFVGGRKVVSEGRVISIDRQAVFDEISDFLASSLSPQERLARERTDQLMHHVRAWFEAAYPDPLRHRYRFNSVSGQA